MTKEDLFNTLQDLKEEDFENFKWHLCQNGIKVCHLDGAKRWETVDAMVRTYGLPGALTEALVVLEKLNMRDLAQNLPRKGTN